MPLGYILCDCDWRGVAPCTYREDTERERCVRHGCLLTMAYNVYPTRAEARKEAQRSKHITACNECTNGHLCEKGERIK